MHRTRRDDLMTTCPRSARRLGDDGEQTLFLLTFVQARPYDPASNGRRGQVAGRACRSSSSSGPSARRAPARRAQGGPMTTSSTATLASRALEQGGGILHLAPTWVPRSFGIPGRRLKLHVDDVYAL